jgi:general secretion pathway protein B
VSFILDALRKSDAERQRAATPGLADIRYARRPTRRSLWLPLLAVALVANLAVMGVQWLRRPAAAPVAGPAATPATDAPVAVAPVTVAPVPVVPRAPAPAVRPLASETEAVADPGAVAAADVPLLEADLTPAEVAALELPVEDPVAVAEPVVAAPAPAPTPPPPASASRIRDTPLLPTADQLIAAGTLRVPTLNLDLHVFNDDPARRFVIVNGARYREGATLREGPTVAEITSDGVILDNQGTRFIVRPR